MSRSNLVVFICMILGLAVLLALGSWQVNRLFWKEALIERVNERVQSDPTNINELVLKGFEKSENEYQPIKAVGTYEHENEVYFFTTGKSGSSGWNVHTPLVLENGDRLIVNRGFVPFHLKDQSKRQEGQITGQQEAVGLLRFPLEERPFGSLENSVGSREYYWRNVPEMALAMGGEKDRYLPVILDLGQMEVPGDLPRGGTTILDFPNNHLQYAITWYGLALTLLGVGGYFIYSRRQITHD